MSHNLKPYKPDEDFEGRTIQTSNLYRGMLREFYNFKTGTHYTVEHDEAKRIDQRVFGPAVARGLIASDGHIWYITEVGINFVKANETRSAWKENYSDNFSHYIHVARMISNGNGRNGRGQDRRRLRRAS